MTSSEALELLLQSMRNPDGIEVKKGVRLISPAPFTLHVSISGLDTLAVTFDPPPKIRVSKILGWVKLEGLVKQFQITPTTINIVIDGLPDQQIAIQ